MLHLVPHPFPKNHCSRCFTRLPGSPVFHARIVSNCSALCVAPSPRNTKSCRAGRSRATRAYTGGAASVRAAAPRESHRPVLRDGGVCRLPRLWPGRSPRLIDRGCFQQGSQPASPKTGCSGRSLGHAVGVQQEQVPWLEDGDASSILRLGKHTQNHRAGRRASNSIRPSLRTR